MLVIPADGLTSEEEQPEDRSQPPKVGVLELDWNHLREELDWRIPRTASDSALSTIIAGKQQTNVKKQIKDRSLSCQKCPSKHGIQ